jgi:hypothetical protein|tara:strand:+ start:190 stop:1131 length:942 start_codon:yes stop_codon:yes gene_type:complete
MSRLRANEVLNQAGTGAVNATEGLTVPAGKSITFTDASEPTLLDGTTLTTTTINVDQIYLSDDDKISLGQDQDLEIYHTGDILGISNIASDKLILRATTGLGDPYVICTQGGSVQLRYSGTPRFETAADGVSISGNITSTYLSTDSSGLTSTYLNTNSTGVAITGSTSSTDGWAGTTSSANVLGGLTMPFSCGLNGRIALPPTNATMLFGGSEYNGDNTEGAAMPHAGKLVAATVHAENAVGNLTLHATLNGTQNSSYEMTFSSPTSTSPTVVETFYSSPMSFAAGDRINFAVNNSTLTQLEVLTVTFFVKFD